MTRDGRGRGGLSDRRERLSLPHYRLGSDIVAREGVVYILVSMHIFVSNMFPPSRREFSLNPYPSKLPQLPFRAFFPSLPPTR